MNTQEMNMNTQETKMKRNSLYGKQTTDLVTEESNIPIDSTNPDAPLKSDFIPTIGEFMDDLTENENPIVFSTTNDVVVLFTVATEKGISFREAVNNEYTVVDMVISKVTIPKEYGNESSGYKQVPCLTFITDDGCMLSTLSKTALRNALLLIQCINISHDNSIRIKIVDKMTKKGLTYTFKILQ